MKIKRSWIVLSIHLIIWFFILEFRVFVGYRVGREFKVLNDVGSVLVYALVFYLVYFFLFRFLIRKKISLFVILSLLLISGAMFAELGLNKRMHHEKRMKFHRELMLEFEEDMDKPQIPFLSKPPRFLAFRMLRSELLGIFFFYFLSIVIRFYQKWQQDEKQRLVSSHEKVQAELSFLKQQINPHFLFNSLNSIYSLSISKSDSTTESILKLSSILRYVLYDSDKESVYLTEELQVLSDYIELQKLRLTDKTKLEYSVSGDSKNLTIEPLLLIPFVENAFKHGVDNVHETTIDISLKISKGSLEFRTVNSVVQQEGGEQHAGIGLKNIKRRLELIYPNSHELITQRIEDIYSVRLQLNLKTR